MQRARPRTSTRLQLSRVTGLVASCAVALFAAGAGPQGCHADRTELRPPTTTTPSQPRPAPTVMASARPAPASAERHAPATPQPPEADTGFDPKPEGSGTTQIIATAHELATRAGYRILADGGSAIDAAVAAQMVLGLVEPQSSGIGGGAFLVYFDGARAVAFDGRETAPARAESDLFLEEGTPLEYSAAATGGRAVGAPGLLAVLEKAHRRYGRLPWARLFEPARRLCLEGFPVSPRLARLLAGQDGRNLLGDGDARAYFFDSAGTPRPAGFILRNPAFAEVLGEIAERGAKAFYRGPTAEAVAAEVAQPAANPGLLSARDLARYRAKERRALCFVYHQYRLCGMPPPSSGALAIGQVLGMLEARTLANYPPVARDFGLEPPPEAVHLVSEALRLAFADRNRYVADPDFVKFPGGTYQSLLLPGYLKARARAIGERSMGHADAGRPDPGGNVTLSDDDSPEFPSTTHLSIVDASGHALAMTSSIERAFGSGLMVRGFLLNNQLTDFSFVPERGGRAVANRVQGTKRPRSSMAPMLVFHEPTGRLMEVTGSPGGSSIISYVLKSLIATLDWQLTPGEVVALPNFGSRNGPTELERFRNSNALMTWLEARGHDIVVIPQTSGIELLVRDPTLPDAPWRGAVDPRREGLVLGDSASDSLDPSAARPVGGRD